MVVYQLHVLLGEYCLGSHYDSVGKAFTIQYSILLRTRQVKEKVISREEGEVKDLYSLVHYLGEPERQVQGPGALMKQ
jgi:hypothetical protein